MKTFSALAAAAVLVSTSVMAAPPTSPYYMNAPYVGAATVQAVGSCKIAKVYAEARWGEIIETATDNVMGEGLITKDGKLIAVVQSAFYLGGTTNTNTDKQRKTYFEDLSSFGAVSTAQALQDLSTGTNCVVDLLEAGPQTKGTYEKIPTTTAGKFNEKFTVIYGFNGAGNPVNSVAGAISTDAKRTFFGKITFTGQRTIVTP